MADIKLTVALPAYHEEENLRLLLPRLQQVLKTLGVNFEILVVDTMTPLDNTALVCKEAGATYINRRGGNYFGNAVRTAISEAHGEFLLFMDADGSHTPEFIPKLFEQSVSNDVVIASRYIESGHTENSLPLILMSRALNITYSIVLGLPCKDVSNSFKLYRASQLKELPLGCDNFDIIEEILFKLKRHNPRLRIKEIPFTFKKRMFGETKRNLVVFIMTYILTMIRLRLSYLLPAKNAALRKD
jgi:dolichol-phosphate mannosyltransferase